MTLKDELPQGTRTYTRNFTDNAGGKLKSYSQLMIEVEPYHSVNEDAFPKIFQVKAGAITRLKAMNPNKEAA